MNFSYTFKQAHNDRLEDAGIKHYRQPVHEGYVIENTDKRQTTTRRIKQVIVTAAQLILK